MPGDSVSTSNTGKSVISQLVTFLATCRAVTLTGVDIDAKAITHNGNKLCGSNMEAKGR